MIDELLHGQSAQGCEARVKHVLKVMNIDMSSSQLDFTTPAQVSILSELIAQFGCSSSCASQLLSMLLNTFMLQALISVERCLPLKQRRIPRSVPKHQKILQDVLWCYLKRYIQDWAKQQKEC